MQNFIAQSMRRFGLAPENKDTPSVTSPARISSVGNGPLAHMEVNDKWSYSTLEYPLDIQSRTDLGHYMMFYVNVPNTTRYNYSVPAPTGKFEKKWSRTANYETTGAIQGHQSYSKKAAHGSDGYDTDGRSWKPGESNKVIARKSHQGTAASTIGVNRTKRTTDSIVLYMPPQITANTAALYKETELGGNLGEAAGRIKSLMSRADGLSIGTVAEGIRGFSDQAAGMLERAVMKVGSQIIGGDMNAAYDKISNRAMNQFLETMFTGVGFRKFSYNWKFSPKNPKEVLEVQRIIRTFRFHMLPELPKDQRFGRYYVVPAEFDIFYMFRGDENVFFNKLVTSVLVNMDINYTPNQYQTFRPIDGFNGTPPTEIDMKLDFMETKLITKADVLEGY